MKTWIVSISTLGRGNYSREEIIPVNTNEDVKVQKIPFISLSCDLKKVSMYFRVSNNRTYILEKSSKMNAHAQDEITAKGNFFAIYITYLIHIKL